MDNPDVVIVGGGIVGAACARALVLRGMTVTVLESGAEEGVATEAAAGMLAPLTETRRDDALLGFCVRARDYYHGLSETLQEETGVDIGLWTEGIVRLGFTEEDVARIKGDIAWQRQQGYNADWLGDEELRERCPGVTGDALGAMLAPEDGAVDPRALHDALLASAREHGVTITLGHRVDGVVIESGRARAVKCGDQNIAAGAVLVAAGAWSARLQGLPAPLTVEPIRGQMLSYDWPEGRPPAIIYGGTSYVLKRGPEALVGTTMEHAEFDASTTEEGLQIVAAKGVRIYPDLEGAEVRRQWAGLRPVTPDGHPYLGRDPRVEGLWYATGHGRNGILLAGITGELTAQMMAGDKVEYDLTPLDPGRFWQF